MHKSFLAHCRQGGFYFKMSKVQSLHLLCCLNSLIPFYTILNWSSRIHAGEDIISAGLVKEEIVLSAHNHQAPRHESSLKRQFSCFTVKIEVIQLIRNERHVKE